MSPELPDLAVTVSGDKIEIALPPSDQSVVPTIPAELRDRDVPAFVVEWILEADEIATIVQDLLQAPTKSLCRIFTVPTEMPQSGGSFDVLPGPQRSFGGSPTPPPIMRNKFDVAGFEAPAEMPGLPEGIKLPGRLVEILISARKLDAWFSKGQRVREWAEEEGLGDLSWMPANS